MRNTGAPLRTTIALALALFGACGREPLTATNSGPDMPGSGGNSGMSTGGSGTATAGSFGTGTGGATVVASGGAVASASGGSGGGTFATGGAAGGAKAGAGGTFATGGAGGAKAGAGGTFATGGARTGAGGSIASGGVGGSSQSCAGVVCVAIPSSCKKIVQDPGACCPTCTDNGCNSCPPLKCQAGMVQQILPGDCCPSCVMDPAELCRSGQKTYLTMEQQMLDKYASAGCKNSTDCTIVVESNACAFVCNVALPTTTASMFTDNLSSMAATYCANCTAPTVSPCVIMTAACVNSKCVAVSGP